MTEVVARAVSDKTVMRVFIADLSWVARDWLSNTVTLSAFAEIQCEAIYNRRASWRRPCPVLLCAVQRVMSGLTASGPGPNCEIDVMGQEPPPALQNIIAESLGIPLPGASEFGVDFF